MTDSAYRAQTAAANSLTSSERGPALVPDSAGTRTLKAANRPVRSNTAMTPDGNADVQLQYARSMTSAAACDWGRPNTGTFSRATTMLAHR